MARPKTEIVIHPVRFQIIRVLMNEKLSTRQIAQRLDEVPMSSLYRHLKILHDAGYIKVSETRVIQGIQEKVYAIDNSPFLVLSDLESATETERLTQFSLYMMMLVGGYSEYLERSSDLNWLSDQSGYTEVVVWASAEELSEFIASLNEALGRLLHKKKNEKRKKQKIAIVTHPIGDLK